MYNSDIQELYRLVSVGTPVLVEQWIGAKTVRC